VIKRGTVTAFGCAALALFAAALPGITNAGGYVRGIDISHHNGEIDFDKVANDGVSFVFAKVTEAQSFVDDRYVGNATAAASAGLAFGAYHFARPDKTANDAVLEARHFVSNAQLGGANLLPVLDLESSGGLGARKLKAWVKSWLAEVRSQLGVKPIIYSTASFWKTYMGNKRWFADNGYQLWIAHWTDAAQPRMPASNWGGNGWTVWQHSSCGSVAGVSGCVDLDRYAGADINALRINSNR
jgi:GH25 family lysozyme M1 (1,4-beta-N-acetylmuramidase)